MASVRVRARQGWFAQAMVEFALALPIFLLVVYGLLESARLIYAYSAVITASREAVRYASGSGLDGSNNPQYADCNGIRSAAKQVGFLLSLTDSDIQIEYDDETPAQTPPPTLTTYCAPGTAVQTGLVLNSGDRVLVTVTSSWNPVLPLFIPLTPHLITSGPSARTILGVIDLNTPEPTTPP